MPMQYVTANNPDTQVEQTQTAQPQTQPKKNPPHFVRRDGNLKVVGWNGQNGWYFIFVKIYKDKDGNFKETNFLTKGELLKASKLLADAYTELVNEANKG